MEILKLFLRLSKNRKLIPGAEEKLLKIHPKQLINKIQNIPMTVYEVNYSYTTIRGNRKEGIKYFVFNTFNPQMDMQTELKIYIENFNKENPNRKLLNVKFLNSKCLGYMTL